MERPWRVFCDSDVKKSRDFAVVAEGRREGKAQKDLTFVTSSTSHR